MTEESILRIKTTITGVLALLTALWGWFGWLIIVWIILMTLDWIVGSIIAFKNGQWKSTKVRQGICHKMGMVLTFLISLAADWIISLVISYLPIVKLPFNYTVLISPLVIVWYIVGELGSLAEHAVSTGAPVPTWLLKILEAGKKAVDAAGEQVSYGNKDDDNVKKH